ncbi:MAG TPA: class I SAM-dependent methyltransferase [Nanoarchaeota archaeon]|nr:class I SAM-dependent methyltransferase [Nanoarchaeota archaeon]
MHYISNSFFASETPTGHKCNEVFAERKLKFLSGKILDVGCGWGRFLQFCGKDAIGIDANSKAVEICKAHRLNVVQMHAEDIKFDSEYFDAVHCESILEHLDDVEKAMNEIHRVMKKNGKLYLTVNAIENRKWRVWEDYTHKRFFSKKSALCLLQDSGFKIIKTGWLLQIPFGFGKLYRFKKVFIVLCCLYGFLKKRQVEIFAQKI